MTFGLPPSTAGRWALCPASPQLESAYKKEFTADADEGIAAHWVVEQVLTGAGIIEEYTDRTAPNGVIISAEMLPHIELYINAIGARTVAIEQVLTGIPGVSPGKPDAFAIDNIDGYFWDFKYGYTIVEAVGNWQLACYAVLIQIANNWRLNVVYATIVQPRPYHPDGRIRTWAISRDETIRLYHDIVSAAERTRDPAAMTVTGDHCRYCRALGSCEAARRAGLNAVDVAYQATPNELTGDELAAEILLLRRAVKAIKLRLDASESNAVSIINGGGAVPGFAMERAFGRAKWRENVSTLELLTNIKLTEPAPVTITEARKRGVPEDLIKKFTTTPETGRKLVASDVAAKAREIFNNGG